MFWLGLAAASARLHGAQADLRDRTISFACRATPLSRILPQLAEATGIRLEEDGDQKDDVLVISAPHVGAADLMAAIARATSSEWRPGPKGGYRLIESASALKREDQDAMAERTRLLRAAIWKELKRGPQEEQARTRMTVGPPPAAGPVSQSIFALLNATDIEAIAALEPNERVVFSTVPTAVQRPYSSDPAPAMASLIAAHNDGLSPRGAQEDGGLASDHAPSFLSVPSERARRPIGAIAKALLAVTRRSLLSFESLQANVRLIDAGGKLAFDESVDLRMAAEPLGGNDRQAEAGEPSLDLADDTKQLCRFYRSIVNGDPDRKLPSALRDKVFRPNLYDPLSFLATDEVMALAKKWKRPVVANLTDDISPLSDWLNETPSGFERRLTETGAERIVPDSRWLLLRPSALGETRRRRIDRYALERLLNAAEAKPLVSLEDVAEYSLHAPSPLEGGFGALYMLSFVPGAFSLNPSALTSWDMLRIYGSLDSAKRQALQGGDRLALTELTAYQLAQLRHMAFGALSCLEVDEGDKPAASGVPGYLRAFLGGLFDDRRDEATEALPNDIPLDAYLAVAASDEPVAVAATTRGAVQSGPLSVMDMDTMALLRLVRDTPYLSEAAPMLGPPEHVKIGQRTVYSFTFHLTPPFSIRASLADNRLGGDSGVVTEGTMPAGFRAALSAHVASLANSPVAALAAMALAALRPGRSELPP